MKLTGREKTAYALGAVGKDMVYMLSSSYVLYYYQDLLGVSAMISNGTPHGILARLCLEHNAK